MFRLTCITLSLLFVCFGASTGFAAKKGTVSIVGGDGGKTGSYSDKKISFVVTPCVRGSGKAARLTITKITDWAIQDRIINAYAKTGTKSISQIIVKADKRRTYFNSPVIKSVTYTESGLTVKLVSMRIKTFRHKEKAITIGCGS